MEGEYSGCSKSLRHLTCLQLAKGEKFRVPCRSCVLSGHKNDCIRGNSARNPRCTRCMDNEVSCERSWAFALAQQVAQRNGLTLDDSRINGKKKSEAGSDVKNKPGARQGAAGGTGKVRGAQGPDLASQPNEDATSSSPFTSSDSDISPAPKPSLSKGSNTRGRVPTSLDGEWGRAPPASRVNR